jgi:hypothetical protein
MVPVHIPVEFEGIYFIRCAARSDDTCTRIELGVVPRDPEVTLADSVRWLVARGHISRRQAGKLATQLAGEPLPVGIGELPADR